MIGYIYKTTFLLDNKIYIGKRQKSKFIKSYYGSGTIIKAKVKKYGTENFTVELIDTAETVEELCKKEIYWIDTFNARDPRIGYNIDIGGTGGATGHIKIHKGNDTKKIWIDELDTYLVDGWYWIDSTSNEYHRINNYKYKEYRKKYREEHKEKLKAQQQQWREQHKEELKVKTKEWQENNKEHIAQVNKEYYINNRDKILEYHKGLDQTEAAKKYYQKHKSQILEKAKKKSLTEEQKQKHREASKRCKEKKKLKKDLQNK